MKDLYCKDRTSWRQWLKTNHEKAGNVWLILHNKANAAPCVTYEEAVEEALCFGWIDSVANKRDSKHHVLYFAVRKPRGVWSKINKARIARLITRGLMTPAGMAKIEEARKNGSWSFLDEVEELRMPLTLKQAFAKNKKALVNFNAFPSSVKKHLFAWVISARKDETRSKRVSEIVSKASKNVRANQWVRR